MNAIHRLTPGLGKRRVASSNTRTQSPSVEGVKSRVPVDENSPAEVDSPVRGLNHQALIRLPAILPMSTVIVLLVGMYAIIVLPSEVRAAAR